MPIEYVKKKAIKEGMPLLQYIGAFADGVEGDSHGYTAKEVCPKLKRAFRAGVAYKKKLTGEQVGDSLGGRYNANLNRKKPTNETC